MIKVNRRVLVLIPIVALLAVLAVVAVIMTRGAPKNSDEQTSGRATGRLPSGRRLTPQGDLVTLGNFPTGAAITADGRFLWTVSAGFGSNDIRIVDTERRQVCQTLPLPGASGGIALDSAHRLAYVSGLANSRWQPSKNGLPGVKGDDVLVYSWTGTCGQARLNRVIPVPPPPGAPTVQTFPPKKPQRSGNSASGATASWPQHLAVSPDGTRLLVALNLADRAAIIDLRRPGQQQSGRQQSDRVRYAPAGSYPYGAAVLPGGRTGLVTNEASGTMSVIDLRRGAKLTDIAVGAPLSHPAAIAVDPTGTRAYVAVSASDEVAVVDLRRHEVERTISVGHASGLGTMPVALTLGPAGDRLFVAESGGDELAVVRLPGRSTPRGQEWTVAGRIPTADQPHAVVTAAAREGRPARLMWVSAEATGDGPNLHGPNPALPGDPIFWAFNPAAPTTDVFNQGTTYLPNVITGRAGLMPLPSDRLVDRLTPAAERQLQPVNATKAPEDTPLRAGGPIKHVFFVVRENRSYDQLLGDIGRGNSDPKLTVFGEKATPNLHALVTRFPLMDSVLANSEASIQGHYWTNAAGVPDYVSRNWVQNYGGRGRPNDFGMYAVSWPGNGFLFDQAERQHISYFNYGEGFDGGTPLVPDRDRSKARLQNLARVNANSDLGVPLTRGGCYPFDGSIGTALDNHEIFDSTLPAGAPAGSHSHMSCFRQRFARQLAANAVPAFNYLTLTSDHTRGTQAGFPTPTAMVADSDQALGQLVDTISHSPIWNSSAIFVVEDDSQDGADHVDAHRIPAAVISPYARRGALLHTRYDLLSVVRSIELILGMRPLGLNDALATPMYDVFTAEALNSEPVTGIPAKVGLLTRNAAGAPGGRASARLPLGRLDEAPQWKLDRILWQSVYGPHSTPPPPGPNAEPGE